MDRPQPSDIPASPGVYLYKDDMGRVIYVGKARVLRRRVLSYFRHDGLPPKTAAMMARAASVEFITTTTEKEAFLLEASLIKKHRPHYNIVLRDDKQYALFRCDTRATWPRLEIVRRARKDGARYFGPFTSALAARETWKLLHRAFPLRRCSDRALKNRVRPCLYQHMGQCMAPCAGNVDKTLYAEKVAQLCAVLSGHAEPLIADLRAAMREASDNLEFERAAALRDQLRAVERTVERQAAVLPAGGDMDVVGVDSDGASLAIGVLFVRGGAVMDGRAFAWPGLCFEDAPEILWSFLAQFYADHAPPPRVLLPWIPRDAEERGDGGDGGAGADRAREAMEQLLAERRGAPARVVAPQNPDDNRLVDMAGSNAREEARRLARRGGDVLASVGRALRLDEPPARIESVDVSHTGGTGTRVGMVVFVDGQPSRPDYRTYAMEDAGGDDYRALHDWVARRIASGPPWPDLLLIDGGRGQVAAVARGLVDAGRPGLFPLAGIAKARDEEGHADRRAGNVADRVFLPGRSNPLPLRPGSPELLFLQGVRDATHRFAITRHRRARQAAALSGELMRLPGVGPATARLLWAAFGSFEAMRQASREDLEKLPGIGRARAAQIWRRLRGDEGPQAGRASAKAVSRGDARTGAGSGAGGERRSS